MTFTVERWDARERSPQFRDALGPGAFPPWVIWADPESDVWWARVRAAFPQFEVVLVDDGEPVGAGWAVPLAWDGTTADLPTGYTDSLRRAVQGHEDGVAPTTQVVCAAVVFPQRSRTGLAGVLLAALRDLAPAAGLTHVLAPVRPAAKAAHPHVPIGVYAGWTRDDGLPADPWLRTHVRIAGRILAPAPASQTFLAPVARWEEWAGRPLPSGEHLLADALVPLVVDRERDTGTMTEPNVWVQHR